MVIGELRDISLDRFRGVLWDLDNTLYEYEPVHRLALEHCAGWASERFGMDPEQFSKYWSLSRKRVHTDLHGQGASHSRLLYFQKMHEGIFGKTNALFSLEMEELYWSVFLDNMKWRPGMEQLLEDLCKKGIRMCVVTDLTAQIQLRKWIRLDLGRFMDFMVSSEEAGVEKPHAAIFELALEKLGLSSGEVIMIGDSGEKDIRGAAGMGIQAIMIE